MMSFLFFILFFFSLILFYVICNLGYNDATELKRIGCHGDSSCGKERKQSRWLAAYLWTSP